MPYPVDVTKIEVRKNLQYSYQRLCPTLKRLVATHRIGRGSGSGSNSRLKLPKLMT